MEWRNPEAFFLFIPWAFLLAWVLWRDQKRRASLQISSVINLASLTPSWRQRLKHVPLLLQALGVGLWIVALARPQEANTKVKRNIEGVDIVIALDISDSMLIEDMKPLNRLESAKQVIRDFVAKRSSDRIGIVIFAGESFTLVPPTLDYQLLLDRVKEITTAQEARIKDGTAIGVGLANAAGRLKDSQAKSRVIIFLTDGENNSGTIDPETALEIAKGYGIKIHSIGIGRDGPTRIPRYDRDFFGNKVKTYLPFESSVNEDLLSRMAKDTGGKYFRATRDNALEGVFEEIDRLEKTKIEVNKFTKYTEKFKPWALAGFLFYLLGVFIGASILRRQP